MKRFSVFVGYILGLFLAIQASPALALTELLATIDRNPVIKGEYFVLNVVADDDLNAAELDTSGLLKDFLVGRTSVGRSTQIINFDTRRETRWQILLAAKKTGVITIPEFTLQNVRSAPIVLTVAAQGSQSDESKNIFLETEVSTKEAYVGQLISYKVKLYLALELQRGVLSAPTLDGAQIKQLGDDKDSNEILNGKRFRVIERTYAIIADAPGELIINGASFSGDVLVESQGRSGMFGFNESRPMQALAERQVIAINAIPASFQGKWFVSDLALLKETWPDEQTEFEVGTPITRTVTLIASNTDETSLPELEFTAPDGLKIYPEKPQRQTFVRDNQIVSQYSITMAIVPSKAGTFELPSISVPWWNPHLKRQETATLAAKVLTIAENHNQPSVPSMQDYAKASSSSFPWHWLSASLALLLLTALILWRKSLNNIQKLQQQLNAAQLARGQVVDSNAKVKAGQPTAKSAPSNAASTIPSAQVAADKINLNAIEQSLINNEISQALGLIQSYVSHIMGQAMTLAQISALSEPLGQSLSDLQAQKYAKSHQQLDIKKLIQELKQLSVVNKTPKKSLISELNP
ncbi:BatD family protein [Shewanella sp. SR44-3]|uniref:BatD family protein n=2 Tax=Shewanella TaxID=22 RepID=UPI001C726820|nr:BatD family protein [Shewanella sp. SR44-3]